MVTEEQKQSLRELVAFHRRRLGIDRHWRISVDVDGENVVNIESNSLSGVENVSDYRQEIIEAAENLIAFIGREDSEPFVIPEQTPST